MSERFAARSGDVLNLLLTAVTGVFPGAVVEALIARLEGTK